MIMMMMMMMMMKIPVMSRFPARLFAFKCGQLRVEE